MTTVSCPYCDVEREVNLSSRPEHTAVQAADSIERPSKASLCDNGHIFYIIF
jgi:sarcosine oxidase delta subunit